MLTAVLKMAVELLTKGKMEVKMVLEKRMG